MKNKILSLISATALLSVATFSVASAQGVGLSNVNADANANVQQNVQAELNVQDEADRVGLSNVNADANANVQQNVQAELNVQDEADRNDNADSGTESNATNAAAQTNVRGNATNTAAQDNRGNATSSSANANGQLTAETHRSAVATFVRRLLNVANREGGIGAEVRVIAQAQSNSASTSAAAITRVANRGALRTFLFGSDYKNLGALRSEIATTKNNIEQLKNLTDKATSDGDKAELSAQINVLEDSQVKVNAFVKAHENTFSIFGWFTKLFTK